MRQFRFRPGLVGVLLLTACLTPTDGSGRFGEARVKPQFADGASPAQRGIHIDSIHTVIRRGDQDLVNAVMPYDADTHQAWIIELNSVADDVVVTMELLVGGSVAYRGTRDLTVTEGTAGRAPLENVPMSYVGTNIAARVDVLPEAIAFSAVGATRQLQAVVYDPDGAVLDKPVSWSSANEAVATVDEHGLVTATGLGNTSITATVDGATDAASVVVDTAMAHSSTITADSVSIAANNTANTRITVRILNHDGMPVGASAGTVTLAATLGTLSDVTDHFDGTYTATLTAGTSAGEAVVTGELNGAAMSDNAVVRLRALTPGSATTTTIVADSAALDANGVASTIVRVVVRDVNGNPLDASSGAVQLTTTLGTLSNVVDHDNGTYSATLTASTTVGTATVTGTLNGEVIADTAFVQMRALAPHASTTTITADSAAIDADATSTALVTVEVRDVNGNLVGHGGDAVTLATTLGTLSTVITDHTDGRYTAVLTAGTVAGTANITGTLNGAAIADNAVVQLRPLAGNPTTTTITADSAAIDADGVSRALVRVVVRDGNGNPVAGADTVRLSTTLGTLSAVTDHADGTYSATLTAGTAAGLAEITGTLNSGVIADTAFVQMRPLEPHALTTTITADSSAIDADATSTTLVAVEVRDINGNLVGRGGDVVRLATTLGTLSVNITDHADGRYTAILTAGTVAGTANITGTLNGAAIGDDAVVQLRPLPGNPTTTTITADSAAIDADGVSRALVRVVVRDANGNLAAGADTVRLSTTLGTLSAVTDHADGTYTATLTAGTTSGIAEITGTLNSGVIADTAFVQMRPLEPHALTTTITADSSAIDADATSTTLVTVAVRDINGNLVGRGGDVVRLATTLGTLSIDITDHADGRYTAILTAGTVAGTANITGTLNDAAIGDTAHVGLRPLTGTPTTTTLAADSTSIAINALSATTVTVTVRDQHGNPVGRSSGTVVLATTRGILSAVIDHGNGTYTATLKADTASSGTSADKSPPLLLVPDTAVVTGTLNGEPIADTARVEFRHEAGSMLHTTIDADSASLVVGSFTTTKITVTLRDAAGNRIYRSGGTVVLQSTLGQLRSLTDHQNGLYTALLKVEAQAGTAVVSGSLNGTPIVDTAAVVFRE